MGWIKQTPQPCSHPEKPSNTPIKGFEHTIGDVWQCDLCKTRFVVTRYDGYYDARPGEGSPGCLWLKEEDKANPNFDPMWGYQK